MIKSVTKALEAEELKLHIHKSTEYLHTTDDQFEEYMNILESHLFELNRLTSLLDKFK